MNHNEIRKMATYMGSKTHRMKKHDLIHAIKRTENNIECFGTPRVDYCDEEICLWRDDCVYQLELEDEGYSVVTTCDSRNLMTQIECLQLDLILLDVEFGNSNGLDILQEIRNKYYDMPVILCSAFDFFRYDMKAIAADYFVTKSSDLSELKSKIRMVFDRTYSYHLKAQRIQSDETGNLRARAEVRSNFCANPKQSNI